MADTSWMARVGARFVNGAMQVSLLGDAMSDAAKPGAMVSGVGGQFNFFEQAFALKDAHAVLTLPATRTSGGKTSSNIVWQLPVTTVPLPLAANTRSIQRRGRSRSALAGVARTSSSSASRSSSTPSPVDADTGTMMVKPIITMMRM